jgi:SAM-dependent methyltransferase
MSEIMPTTREEFNAVLKYCKGLGADVGCGTNRLDKSVLSLDHYPHDLLPNKTGHNGGNDIICDCAKLPFRDETLDFIFSSHCLEDFAPDKIKNVFLEWLRCVKKGGYLILLLPDMQGGRYPKVGDKEGNPSHLVDVGVAFMDELIKGLSVDVVQRDTIDHKRFFTFDYVIKKREVL